MFRVPVQCQSGVGWQVRQLSEHPALRSTDTQYQYQLLAVPTRKPKEPVRSEQCTRPQKWEAKGESAKLCTVPGPILRLGSPQDLGWLRVPLEQGCRGRALRCCRCRCLTQWGSADIPACSAQMLDAVYSVPNGTSTVPPLAGEERAGRTHLTSRRRETSTLSVPAG